MCKVPFTSLEVSLLLEGALKSPQPLSLQTDQPQFSACLPKICSSPVIKLVAVFVFWPRSLIHMGPMCKFLLIKLQISIDTLLCVCPVSGISIQNTCEYPLVQTSVHSCISTAKISGFLYKGMKTTMTKPFILVWIQKCVSLLLFFRISIFCSLLSVLDYGVYPRREDPPWACSERCNFCHTLCKELSAELSLIALYN